MSNAIAPSPGLTLLNGRNARSTRDAGIGARMTLQPRCRETFSRSLRDPMMTSRAPCARALDKRTLVAICDESTHREDRDENVCCIDRAHRAGMSHDGVRPEHDGQHRRDALR